MEKDWDEYNRSEKPALDLLEKLGYDVYDYFQTQKRPKRESEHQVILLDKLRSAIKRLNPWISENNLAKAINMIRPARIKATSMMEGNEIIYKRLVEYISVQQDLGHGKKGQTVKYIDFDNPENNEYTVINQYRVKGNKVIKPDIVVFINGIPVGVIECKNDTTCDEPKYEAIKQLRRYQNLNGDIGAEYLFYTNQIVAGAWHSSASASTIGAPARKFKEWKDPYPETKEDIAKFIGHEPTKQDILIYSMFKKERLLDLIRNYTVFEHKGNSMVKMMARYQQYRAVNKALERIKNEDTPEGRSGTVWHTQGSGKSLSMLFLSLKLKRWEKLNDPTLLIVTDRVDLNEQIKGTFERCGFPNPVTAKNISHLKELLKSEAGRTIMTLVHKFQENDNDKYPVLSKDDETFVMVDEAHRTQYKELAANMRTALPNACYIGFTGTPIDKETRSTLRTFGDYIDTYTIEQSVEDGDTLPIKYEGRLPELRVEGKDLDEIFDRVFKDYSKEEKKKIKQEHATESDLAEATNRIEKISLDIIKHYEDKISPLKGQIVTVSKEAAAKYGDMMKELNGPESAVIYSKDVNRDSKRVRKYHTTPEKRNEIISRFKDPDSSLTFLIVCDMLLTGFDAPVEQVMYLDKPLKEHNLLQAIARVNRRFEEKNYGLIVDYYGVFDHLQKALAIFNKKDVENAVTPVRDEKPKLEANYREVMRFFRDVNMDDLDECILAFKDKDKRIKFKKAFKNFAKSMDIIMPDPIANSYRDDLKTLGKIYRAVRNHYRDNDLNVKGVGDKVKRLIDKHIRTTDIKRLNKPVSILKEDEFNEVLNETKSKEAKASEMEHAIKKEINVKMEENPVFYQSLSERLEEIIEKRTQGRLDFSEQIEEMGEIISKIRNVRTRAEKLGLNEKEFALYELLADEAEYKNEKVAEGANTYTTGNNNNDNLNVNKKIKKITQNLMSKLDDLVIKDWRTDPKRLKTMRKTIKVTLKDYEEFNPKLKELTTRIMKLSRKILMIL